MGGEHKTLRTGSCLAMQIRHSEANVDFPLGGASESTKADNWYMLAPDIRVLLGESDRVRIAEASQDTTTHMRPLAWRV